jgi:single-stranded-DNA-specific exonuclease
MAAGLSLPAGHFDAFAAAFEQSARRQLGDVAAGEVLWSDGELPPAAATLDTADSLRGAGPWGQAFPEPAFDGEFEVTEVRVVGVRHQRLRLRHARCGTPVEAMHFGGVEQGEPPPRIRALYQVAVDDWRGERRVRLFVRHREPA